MEYPDYLAWCQLAKIELPMRVIEELHRVSVAFVNALRHYSDEKHKGDPPPYESEEKLQARLEAQALIDQQILEERRAYLMKHKR